MSFTMKSSAAAFGLVFSALALFACPATLDDRCAEGACDLKSGDAISPTEAGPGQDAQTDSCVETPSAPKCLDESKAYFVSPQGDDSNAGTMAKPFKTVSTALGKVSADKKRIYICEGTYDEDLRLTEAHGGVSLIGMTCAWTSPPAAAPKFGKSTLALRIDSAQGVAISNLAFEAKDATEEGGSSIAAFVANGGVDFSGVSLTAGLGKDGAAGTLTNFDFPSAVALQGNAGGADAQTGGEAKSYDCPGKDTSVGGKGGDKGEQGDDGTPGPTNKGKVALCGEGGTGQPGVKGESPASAEGASRHGTLDGDWHPESGANGKPGGAGQGGGGGYGTGGAGGGGGVGGCGGAGGGGGKGGGSSIALASSGSTTALTACLLESKRAGNGGGGVAGQSGQQTGGIGGNRSGAACNGGDGGRGGDGAPGGGGAGGLSVAVLYKGSLPHLDQATTSRIKLGVKGDPGAGPGKPGIDGVAVATLEAE